MGNNKENGLITQAFLIRHQIETIMEEQESRQEVLASPYGSNRIQTPEEMKAGIPSEWINPLRTSAVPLAEQSLPYHEIDTVQSVNKHLHRQGPTQRSLPVRVRRKMREQYRSEGRKLKRAREQLVNLIANQAEVKRR